jgi:hypothetical protein
MLPSSGPLASAGAATGHGLPGAALRRVLDHIEMNLHRVSIATVAQAVGFRTPSHFTTVFRRSMGVTPSAYRAAARGLRVAPRGTGVNGRMGVAIPRVPSSEAALVTIRRSPEA